MSDNGKHKPVQGTREWAVATVDCCIGCPHGCRYCYARYKQVEKLQLTTEAKWKHPQLIESAISAEYPLYDGQVMFPAHHDIVPENLDGCMQVLQSLLAAGNKVLVVSKPHLSCIKALMDEFEAYSHQLLFRLTITARNPEILLFWEPEAPFYSERRACLVSLYNRGFQTSVSIEPMLDRNDVVDMVEELMPYVTDSIWIGKLNKIRERVKVAGDVDRAFIRAVEEGLSDSRIWSLYEALKDREKIRWKESIKDVVGLPRSAQDGLDR